MRIAGALCVTFLHALFVPVSRSSRTRILRFVFKCSKALDAMRAGAQSVGPPLPVAWVPHLEVRPMPLIISCAPSRTMFADPANPPTDALVAGEGVIGTIQTAVVLSLAAPAAWLRGTRTSKASGIRLQAPRVVCHTISRFPGTLLALTAMALAF